MGHAQAGVGTRQWVVQAQPREAWVGNGWLVQARPCKALVAHGHRPYTPYRTLLHSIEHSTYEVTGGPHLPCPTTKQGTGILVCSEIENILYVKLTLETANQLQCSCHIVLDMANHLLAYLRYDSRLHLLSTNCCRQYFSCSHSVAYPNSSPCHQPTLIPP